jgi:hypothetical protein
MFAAPRAARRAPAGVRPRAGSWLFPRRVGHGDLSLPMLAIFVPLALHRFNNTVSA